MRRALYAAVLLLAVGGCTGSPVQPPTATPTVTASATGSAANPSPSASAREFDLLNGTFPDAQAEGVVTVANMKIDIGWGVIQGDGRVLMVDGAVRGVIGDRFGLMDPATGKMEWLTPHLATAKKEEFALGDKSGPWLVWDQDYDDGISHPAKLPYVYSHNIDTGRTYLLANRFVDAEGMIYVPAGQFSGISILGGRAYWVDNEPKSGDFAVFSRDLEAKEPVKVTHAHGSVLTRDLCAEEQGKNALTFIGAGADGKEGIFRIDEDGTITATTGPTFVGNFRYDVGTQCGSDYAGRLTETGDGSEVEDALELVEGDRVTTFRSGDGGNLGGITLSTDWLAFCIYNGGSDAEGRQFVYHRPTRQLYRLPVFHFPPAATMRQQPGYLTFGYDPTPDDQYHADRTVELGRLHPPK